ncbi:MAG: hypothetical protein ACP5XB_19965 [Isosphaeraceae bacterium]
MSVKQPGHRYAKSGQERLRSQLLAKIAQLGFRKGAVGLDGAVVGVDDPD